MTKAKAQRLATANAIIVAISQHGRGFFSHKGRVSRFEVAPNGRLWYRDGYTDKLIYVAYRKSRWRGFTEGGTLREFIENLADYIVRNAPIRNHFGPWPEWLCGGDLWAYGGAMSDLRSQLALLLPQPLAPRYDKLSPSPAPEKP